MIGGYVVAAGRGEEFCIRNVGVWLDESLCVERVGLVAVVVEKDVEGG